MQASQIASCASECLRCRGVIGPVNLGGARQQGIWKQLVCYQAMDRHAQPPQQSPEQRRIMNLTEQQQQGLIASSDCFLELYEINNTPVISK